MDHIILTVMITAGSLLALAVVAKLISFVSSMPGEAAAVRAANASDFTGPQHSVASIHRSGIHEFTVVTTDGMTVTIPERDILYLPGNAYRVAENKGRYVLLKPWAGVDSRNG